MTFRFTEEQFLKLDQIRQDLADPMLVSDRRIRLKSSDEIYELLGEINQQQIKVAPKPSLVNPEPISVHSRVEVPVMPKA